MVQRSSSARQRASTEVIHVDRLWQRLTDSSLGDHAARPIQDLAEQCLVLLGEPGIGKSTVVKHYAASLQQGGTEDVLFANLGAYNSEDRLFADVLRSEQVREWLHGTHVLHLFLDGLDEGLGPLPNLPTTLTTELKGWPLHRLRLVITCRSADWPTSLETGLTALIDAVGLYTVLPLEQHDVARIAEGNGVAREAFMADLSAAGVWDLAKIPLTLRLLMKVYFAEGAFPGEQTDLFTKGLTELCRDHARHPFVSPEERLLVAERLAAMTVFGGPPLP